MRVQQLGKLIWINIVSAEICITSNDNKILMIIGWFFGDLFDGCFGSCYPQPTILRMSVHCLQIKTSSYTCK